MTEDPEDQRRRSVLFNDITRAAVDGYIPLGDRLRIMEHLWVQGWRRDVRPDDITERPTIVLDITEHRPLQPPPPAMPAPLPDPVVPST